jgi:hypothetical protein
MRSHQAQAMKNLIPVFNTEVWFINSNMFVLILCSWCANNVFLLEMEFCITMYNRNKHIRKFWYLLLEKLLCRIFSQLRMH